MVGTAGRTVVVVTVLLVILVWNTCHAGLTGCAKSVGSQPNGTASGLSPRPLRAAAMIAARCGNDDEVGATLGTAHGTMFRYTALAVMPPTRDAGIAVPSDLRSQSG